MKSELVVDVRPEEISIALTENDRLMEVSKEAREEETFAVGNIYWGRVKKVMPALNAVFVDVGYEKEAFLHYLDLGSKFLCLQQFTEQARANKGRKPSLDKAVGQKEVGKEGNIQDYLKVGQELLVQVTKEPINTKGPRLTAEISMAGRNIVLMPLGEKVMVSSKIRSEGEKSRLKQLVRGIKPAHFGVIVRTQAEGKRAADLDAEMKLLLKRWDETVARLQKAKGVSLVTEEIGRTIGVIRDIFTPESFSAIHVNDAAMFQEIQQYVGLIAPEAANLVHLYQSAEPIFDHFQITRQMKTGLGRTVGFKNGGYLIMERTEALFSIDVNSGSKKLGQDQEDNAFQCNMLAADEIAHQLRLRDIGGIIIVDFIDMDSAEHRQRLFEHMRTLMKNDRARHNVLQLSKFGLMQITRQRVRMAVEVDVTEECPTCHGNGRVEPSILFTDKLEEECERYNEQFGSGLTLRIHPYLYAYVTKGLFWKTLAWKWRWQYGIRVVPSEVLGMLEYMFLSKDLTPLRIREKARLTVDQKEDKKAKRYTAQKIEEKPEVVLDKTGETPKEAPKKKETAPKEAAPTPQEATAGEEAPQKLSRNARRRRNKKARELAAKAAAEAVEVSNAEASVAEVPVAESSIPEAVVAEVPTSETPVAEAAPIEASDAPAAPAKKKRSTRKPKVQKAAEEAAPAEPVGVLAEEKPVAEEAAPAPAKKKRPARKPKAQKAEAVEEAPKTESAEAPVAEAAPKKKRAPRRKPKAKEEAPASTEESAKE